MPSMRFTVRGIEAIKSPKDGRVEYWDKGMPGFGLRVSYSGAMTWVTMYRHLGRPRRHTLGSYPAMTLADAHEKARRSLNDAANGKDPAGEKRAERIADTFGELAAEYIEKHAKKKKDEGREDDRIINKDLLPRWKNLKAKDVTRRDVIRVLDAVVDRGAPVHANRVLALVRKMFNFAISRDIVEHNPCTAVPLPTKPKSRDRVLSTDEIRAFWESAKLEDSSISAMVTLRLLTAQRGGEIESMAWADLDLDAGVWTIPAEKAKNGLAHRVPLNKPALSIMKGLQQSRSKSPWVFASPIDKGARHIENVQKAIQRIRTRPDYEVEFTGHDLRRTAASLMASLGVSRLVISKILNHIESGVTAVYDRHGYDAEKRQALELWGDYLMNIVNRKAEAKVVPLTVKASKTKKNETLRAYSKRTN